MCVIFEPRPSSAGELPACKAKSAGMATGIMHTRRKVDCRAGAVIGRPDGARPDPGPLVRRPRFSRIARNLSSGGASRRPVGSIRATGLSLPDGQNTREGVKPRGRKYSTLPKFGIGVCVAHPGSPRGAILCRHCREPGCGRRGSVGRGRSRAGRIALREPKTSCRMSGAVRFVSSVSFRLRRQG
jgi:hypothetical protein